MTDETNRDPETITLSSRKLLLLSVVSFLVYLALSLMLFRYYHPGGLSGVFDHGIPVWGQLASGLAAGSLAAAGIRLIITHSPVSGVLNDFYIVRVLSRSRFTWTDCLQLSFFAGVGEELLFRGAIQPLLGIWITSVIFVGLHGYFKFNSMGHFLFGAAMFGLSVLLGFLFEYAGLIAAMSAHAVYDLIMLRIVQQEGRRE